MESKPPFSSCSNYTCTAPACLKLPFTVHISAVLGSSVLDFLDVDVNGCSHSPGAEGSVASSCSCASHGCLSAACTSMRLRGSNCSILSSRSSASGSASGNFLCHGTRCRTAAAHASSRVTPCAAPERGDHAGPCCYGLAMMLHVPLLCTAQRRACTGLRVMGSTAKHPSTNEGHASQRTNPWQAGCVPCLPLRSPPAVAVP